MCSSESDAQKRWSIYGDAIWYIHNFDMFIQNYWLFRALYASEKFVGNYAIAFINGENKRYFVVRSL